MKHLQGVVSKTPLGVGTHQGQPTDTSQILNAAGGYTFKLDDWDRLARFLILGTQGGTYYVNEQDFTKQNFDVLKGLIQTDAMRVLTAIDLALNSAIKPDYCIFALAAVAGLGNVEAKQAALYTSLPRVCRTGGQLLQFVSYVQQFRGWGAALRKAIRGWYESRSSRDLAYQVTKYQNRAGYTQNDLLRLAHGGGKSYEGQHIHTFKYVKGQLTYEQILELNKADGSRDSAMELISAIEYAKHTKFETTQEMAAYVEQFKLVREVIPTEWLKNAEVWQALLTDMPVGALLRNLGNLAKNNVITPSNRAVIDKIKSVLLNRDILKRGHVHPMSVLLANQVYASGSSVRGSGTWIPVQEIKETLDQAFYAAFDAVDATGLNILCALDVSGSMTATINNVPGLTAYGASAAMACVHANTEPNIEFMMFDTRHYSLPLLKGHRITDVIGYVNQTGHGGTDCSMPFQYAAHYNKKYDAIMVYTDNETWAGNMHAWQAIEAYRVRLNPKMKVIWCATTATGNSLRKTDDPLTLDVIGFDAMVPTVIDRFLRSE